MITHEEQLHLAHLFYKHDCDYNEYDVNVELLTLAESYIALTAEINKLKIQYDQMSEQADKTIAFHRDMAARFAEDRDIQKHALRETKAELDKLKLEGVNNE